MVLQPQRLRCTYERRDVLAVVDRLGRRLPVGLDALRAELRDEVTQSDARLEAVVHIPGEPLEIRGPADHLADPLDCLHIGRALVLLLPRRHGRRVRAAAGVGSLFRARWHSPSQRVVGSMIGTSSTFPLPAYKIRLYLCNLLSV